MALNRMSPKGKQVLRLGGIIRSVIIAICLITALLLTYYWLEWLEGSAFSIACIIAGGMILIQIIGDCFIRPWLMYRQHGFLLTTHTIVVQEGMWFVKYRNIPLFRIQNVDIEEGWLMQKKALVTLKFSTAGGTSEIILVEKMTAEHIMEMIKHASHIKSAGKELGEEY